MPDIRTMFQELAMPLQLGDRVKSQIWRAAKAADISVGRGTKLWYGEVRRLEQYEAEKIERAWKLKKSEEENRKLLNEWHQHRAQMAQIEATLLAKDAEYYGPLLTPYKLGFRTVG